MCSALIIDYSEALEKSKTNNSSQSLSLSPLSQERVGETVPISTRLLRASVGRRDLT